MEIKTPPKTVTVTHLDYYLPNRALPIQFDLWPGDTINPDPDTQSEEIIKAARDGHPARIIQINLGHIAMRECTTRTYILPEEKKKPHVEEASSPKNATPIDEAEMESH